MKITQLQTPAILLDLDRMERNLQKYHTAALAHGNGNIRGFGTVVGHPELTVCALSEEVGKIRAEGTTDLQVGDRIRIIPNHACSTANLTSYYVGVRGDEAERLIAVDLRSNATGKAFA